MIVIHSNDEYSGLVCQNPDDPEVPNPGKWFAIVQTRFLVPYWFKRPFNSKEDAVAAVVDALKKNKTEHSLEKEDKWLSLQ